MALDGPRPMRNARRAWVLPPDRDSGLLPGALGLLADALPELLSPHGFDIQVEAFPAQQVTRNDVAVVAAHGGVRPDGTFGVIADERERRHTVADLVAALADSTVVIALICSGGRQSFDPFTHRPVGLPRALLAAGCASVVASPWPLSAPAAMAWLPLFWTQWQSGIGLVDAVYRANQQLRQRLRRRNLLRQQKSPHLRDTCQTSRTDARRRMKGQRVFERFIW